MAAGARRIAMRLMQMPHAFPSNWALRSSTMRAVSSRAGRRPPMTTAHGRRGRRRPRRLRAVDEPRPEHDSFPYRGRHAAGRGQGGRTCAATPGTDLEPRRARACQYDADGVAQRPLRRARAGWSPPEIHAPQACTLKVHLFPNYEPIEFRINDYTHERTDVVDGEYGPFEVRAPRRRQLLRAAQRRVAVAAL